MGLRIVLSILFTPSLKDGVELLLCLPLISPCNTQF